MTTKVHASREELVEIIKTINPKKVFPIHTEHPEMFRRYFRDVERVGREIEYKT